MKTFSTLAAAAALAFATTGAVAADTKKIETDPFASTQSGEAIGWVAGIGAIILIVAADKT